MRSLSPKRLKFFIVLLVMAAAACGRTTFKPIEQLNPHSASDPEASNAEQDAADELELSIYAGPQGTSELSKLNAIADPNKPENKKLAESVQDFTVKDAGDKLEVHVTTTEDNKPKQLVFEVPKNKTGNFDQVFLSSDPEWGLATSGNSYVLQRFARGSATDKQMAFNSVPAVASAGIIYRPNTVDADLRVPRSAGNVTPDLLPRLQSVAKEWHVDTVYIGNSTRVKLYDSSGKVSFEGRLPESGLSLTEENGEESPPIPLKNTSTEQQFSNVTAELKSVAPSQDAQQLIITLTDPSAPENANRIVVVTRPKAKPSVHVKLAANHPVLPAGTVDENAKETITNLEILAQREDIQAHIKELTAEGNLDHLNTYFINVYKRRNEILAAFFNEDIKDMTPLIAYITGPETQYFSDPTWPIQCPYWSRKESTALGPLQIVGSTAKDTAGLLVYPYECRQNNFAEYNRCDQRASLYYSIVGAARVIKNHGQDMKEALAEKNLPYDPMYSYWGYRWGPNESGYMTKEFLRRVTQFAEKSQEYGLTFWEAAKFTIQKKNRRGRIVKIESDYDYFVGIVSLQIISLDPQAYGVNIEYDGPPVSDDVIFNGYCKEQKGKNPIPTIDIHDALKMVTPVG